ncbi:MAG: hypothetical protein KAS57_00935 [Gammaproteobacteria bacterium]|nr:hypothetical protein [Gammaproteobacteria bacterium]
MQKLMIKFEKYLESQSKRDQIALFVIFFIVVIFSWNGLLREPLAKEIMVTEQDISQVGTELVILQSKIKVSKIKNQEDPDSENRERLVRYVEENKRLDEALNKSSVQFINPQEMAGLLEQILKNQTDLKFVSLKNMPATPEFVESSSKEESDAGNVNTIYRHSVVLQMEGSYHSVLSYLKKLEHFPWKFFWQGIEIETSKYPNSLITLEVYTLGFREGIIGV